MSTYRAPRCGQPIRGGKTCGRPAHSGGRHRSEEAYARQLARTARWRAKGPGAISTHGYSGYSNGCRCQVCRDAKAAYMAGRRAAAFTADSAPEQDPAVTHGTRFAYEERGCRCGQCVAAERASSRRVPRKSRARLLATGAQEDQSGGGSVSTATGTVTVSVTQEHIDRGRPCQCSDCPIALAFLASVPDLIRVSVNDEVDKSARLYYLDGGKVSVWLPKEATDFIAAFDNEEPVEPFTFAVEVIR